MVETDAVTVQGQVHFTVLRGTVGADADGEAIALGGPQQRRLLAALLADPGAVVTADQLVDYVWPEDGAPDQARRTVMSYISRLRSAVGSDHVVLRDTGYQIVLDGGASYDATEFELALARARASEPGDAVAAYDAALGYWSGRAFGDEADEWWLRPVAARLEELRLVAQEERAERLIDEGRHADAVADLERLVVEQPLRERFVELLMRALYLGGRQAEALRAYRTFADYLADETGLPPSDTLVDLEHRITLGDPTLAPTTGLAVPGYELGDVIGEGAFGTVYRATQPSVGREVAVKVVRAELADDPRFVQRFEAEAQLVARLEHPHVVPLYDFWRRPGGAFLVFRLLRGGSLSDRIADGRVPMEDATRLVTEIGGALGAAHALGVVHRDVKPANVLFDEAGNSYLADFGISVLSEEEEAIDLRSAGSPLYASPEQARDGAATAASDQYALAVVVWEALAGRAPFSGSSTTEVLQSKFTATVPRLSEFVAVPEALDEVLRRATAPHPDDRYPSIAEFVQAWHLALAGTADAIRTTGGLTAAPETRTVSSTVASMPAVGANPYKGLRAFREADAVDYRGRDDLVARLVAAVESEPFVAVVGPSGSGKSSLVHAGVVPEFRRRGALVVSMVPGTAPMAELEAALRRVATVEDESAIGERLRAPGGLVAVAADLADGEQLVLVVDQFEELWTLVDSAAERDRFAELLEHAAMADQSALRVVVTLRADLYDRPLQHPGLGRVVSGATFAVTPMSASELQDAIVGPAERAGVRFEPGLVGAMIGEVVSRPGALPLLQFTLTELYERRQNATVTTKAYEELGGIGGALASRAEELYAGMDPDRQRGVRMLFTQLVTPGDDNDDLRRRATTGELAGVPPEVIEQYRTNRLLVTDHHPITREPTVEVAHEALLREWPRLREWIDADRDTIRLRRLITQTTGEWEAAGRDESVLYRGPRLAAADDVARRMPLAAPEREFLAASHELADRERVETEQRAVTQARQNRRLRRALVATAVVLVVAIVFGALAVTQRSKANDNAARADANAATARQQLLISQSQSTLPTDRQLAALLAVQADRQDPNADTRDAMLNVVMAEPRIQQTFFRATGALEPITDHRVVVSPDPTKRLEVYDWRTGRQVPWPATSARPTKVASVSASPDTTVLALLGADGRVWTYSGRTLAPIGTPVATGIRNGAMTLGFDGRTLAVWGDEFPDTPGRDVLAVYTRSGDTWVRAPEPAGLRVTPHTADFSADGSVFAAVAYEPTAEGTEQSDLTVNDVATGALLHSFKVPAAYDIALDWARRRVVVSRKIGGAPGDISWYDLNEFVPVEHVVDQGLSPIGSADLAYDATYTRLGVNGIAGMQAFDAATMAPPPGIAEVHTGTQQGPIRFVDPDQVLLATVGAGPVSRWDLTGTSTLAGPDADEFDRGVGPAGYRDRLLGSSTAGPDTTVTVLDADRRPLGPPIPVTRDLASLPAPVQGAARKLTPAVCVDRRSGRIATVSVGTGDVVIRSGIPPFRELSRAPGVAAGLATSSGCTWRPDGRQIAIGNYPQTELAGVTSVALYDVAGRKLRSTHAVSELIATVSLLYRPDSKILWVSGPSGGTAEVHELTDLDGRPRIRTAMRGSAIAFDAAGRLVIVTDNTIRRYDSRTLRPLGPPLDVRGNNSYDVSPAPAGGEVVLTSTDGWRLVDLDAGRTLGPQMPTPSQGLAAFSGRGADVSAYSGTGPARAQWDLAPARVRTAACSLAGRNLTAAEWKRYLPTAGPRQRTCPRYPRG